VEPAVPLQPHRGPQWSKHPPHKPWRTPRQSTWTCRKKVVTLWRGARARAAFLAGPGTPQGTHAEAVGEELQPVGRIHVGQVHGELSPVGRTPRWSQGGA